MRIQTIFWVILSFRPFWVFWVELKLNFELELKFWTSLPWNRRSSSPLIYSTLSKLMSHQWWVVMSHNESCISVSNKPPIIYYINNNMVMGLLGKMFPSDMFPNQSSKSTLIFRVEVGSRSKVKFSGLLLFSGFLLIKVIFTEQNIHRRLE